MASQQAGGIEGNLYQHSYQQRSDGMHLPVRTFRH